MIYYISGGERSGKSSFAQELALQLTDNPVYLATAKIWDDDFKERVIRHQAERDERWTSIEEEKELSQLELSGRVVVVDCVTLWLTNFYSEVAYNHQEALELVKKEFSKILKVDATWIFISNEIGMGLHADNKVGRKFVELQGWTNQMIAKQADKAYFMVSGLPITVK